MEDETIPMSPEDSFAPELLDLHLGRLTSAEMPLWRARLAADPELARQDEALASVFQALGHASVAPAPPDLRQRIMSRIAQAGRPPRVVRPADDLTRAAEHAGVRIIRLGSLREIVAVAAILVLLVSVGVPSMLSMRERGQRIGCARNLALLGQGVQQYASMFGGVPFAGWNARTSWRPTDEPGMVTLPNRIHMYPLLRSAFVLDPRTFVCPGRSDVPMSKDQIAQRNDFVESRNVSYAYYNMAGVRPNPHDLPALPILADDTPVFDDGVPLFDLRLRDPAGQNSRAHRGAGQNVLMLDGHFKWSTTPYDGIDGDNIWTLQGVRMYTGHEGPASATDAQLLK